MQATESLNNNVINCDFSLLVILVLNQLAVTTGKQVTGLAEQLQWFLFVDVTEHRPLSRYIMHLWKTTKGSSFESSFGGI